MYFIKLKSAYIWVKSASKACHLSKVQKLKLWNGILLVYLKQFKANSFFCNCNAIIAMPRNFLSAVQCINCVHCFWVKWKVTTLWLFVHAITDIYWIPTCQTQIANLKGLNGSHYLLINGFKLKLHNCNFKIKWFEWLCAKDSFFRLFKFLSQVDKEVLVVIFVYLFLCCESLRLRLITNQDLLPETKCR